MCNVFKLIYTTYTNTHPACILTSKLILVITFQTFNSVNDNQQAALRTSVTDCSCSHPQTHSSQQHENNEADADSSLLALSDSSLLRALPSCKGKYTRTARNERGGVMRQLKSFVGVILRLSKFSIEINCSLRTSSCA